MARKTFGQARTLTTNQLNRVLKRVGNENHGERNQTILILSHYLGLRAKELASLKMWQVVNGDGRAKEVLQLEPTNTKGGKFREVPLTHPKVREALKEWVEYRFSEYNTRGNSYLFRSQKLTAFSPNSMSRMISILYKNAGYDGATSHSGRRSMITKLANAGVDLNSVRILAGHSSLQTTQLYIDHDPNKLGNIMKNL